MRICGEIPSVALHDLYFLYMRCTKNAQANVSRGRWFRHSHISRRSRFYGGSGAYRPPRREMAGIPGVSRLTFLTLPRFSRVPGPCSYRFSLFSLWICHVLRGFCTRCCHVFPFCGCMRVHVGAYGGVRALIGACGRSRLSPRSPPRTPPRRLPCRRAARGWRRRPVGAAGRAGWDRPPPGGRR